MKNLFIISFLCSFLFMQTDVSGSVSGDWILLNSPYIVTNNLVLQPSDTLNISPGVEIRFDGNYRFDIFGTIFAIGTESDSIKFTKNIDDNWMSLNFADLSNDQSVMQYCIVEYASDSGYEPYLGAINCSNSGPSILNCSISHCSSYGLYLVHSDNSQIVSNFISDVYGAIFIKDTFSSNLSYNVINSSSSDGIFINTDCSLVDILFNSISNCGSNGIGINNGNDSLLISSNSIFDNSHDGIYINSYNDDIALVDNYLSNNFYGIRSGGSNSNMFIHDNVITSNSNDGINLGGSNNQNFSLLGNLIHNNSGFGVYTGNSNSIFGSIIWNVISSNLNGGIYIQRFSSGPSLILNNTIFNNSGSGGIRLTFLDTITEVINNCISSNYIGISTYSSNNLSINNNNVWDNTSGDFDGNFPDGTGNLININLNGNVCDNYFNISESPLFVDQNILDFNLLPNSPNIDAGDPDYLDLDGTISDIGAFPLLQDVAAFYLSSNEINFGQVILGETDTLTVAITSTGTIDLTVSGIQIDGDVFFVQDDNFILSNGEQYFFDVIFSPPDNLSYNSVLTIFNNSSNPEFQLNVSGTAYDIYTGPTFFVDLNGSDINNGSVALPFATIQHAVNSTTDGDTISISSGIYPVNSIDIDHTIHFFGSGIDSTFIDAENDGYIFSYNYDSQDTVFINGLNFINGYYTSTWPSGGGIIFESNNGALKVSNCAFSNNRFYSPNSYEGAGAINSSGFVECINSFFYNNVAQFGGAAILFRGGGIINNCVFEDNFSQYAVNLKNNGNVLVSNSSFFNNNSGAISVYSLQDVQISNVLAWQNTADNGAFLNLDNCTNVLIDSVIAFTNHATSNGGAIHSSNSSFILNKSDIVFNSASNSGGGIFLNNSTQFPQFTNSIFWGNTGGGDLNQISISNGVLDVAYCNVQGGYDGTAIINSNPLFFDVLNFDFDLQADSPCINAGDPTSPFDPDSSITDIGRFHYPVGDFVDEFSISSIVDVPEDNGGQVIISWHRSIYDGLLSLFNITHYAIWRWNKTDDIVIPDFSPFSRDGWEFIGVSPAQEFQDYSFIAPTLVDSSNTDFNLTSFLIVAHTSDDDIFFVSEPDSGYSVDNLSPPVPGELVVSDYGANFTIEWASPEVSDIDFFSVFRDSIFIINTTSNYFTDSNTNYGDFYLYQISATDIHNNQSDLSESLFVVSGFIGDINEDQIIDILDVVLMVGFILDFDVPGIFESWVADLTYDDQIDVLDIVLLVSIILDS